MLKLATVFEDAAGKKHRWNFNNPNPNKSPEEIKILLEKMTTLNLFEKDGVKQFQKVVSAKFVETLETPLFDLRNAESTNVQNLNNSFAPQIITEDLSQSENQEQPKVTPIEVAEAIEQPEMEVHLAIEETPNLEELLEESIALPIDMGKTDDSAESIPTQKAELSISETAVQEPTPTPERTKESAHSRKERLDRLRIYHETNKKKKKRKKKKR
ncbi:DUF2922 domain-containing protein [Enterococcus sp. AZ109]|uniref:DUF2922 domain-containing protein n=1 Tax=Enterococcus sp. AZ109 TaxID=2774634 RepID=UPI003F28F9DE